MWYPGVLANASWSSEYLAHRLHRHIAENDDEIPLDDLKKWINEELVVPGLGIDDATGEELTAAALYPAAARAVLAKMISDRAQIGWSTHGHSAVDVNIYSSGGPGTEAIRGNVENTDVGRFLREYLDVDVEAVTRELRAAREERLREDGAEAERAALQAHQAEEAQSQDHWAEHEAMEEEAEEMEWVEFE